MMIWPIVGGSASRQDPNQEKDFQEAVVALKSGYANMAYSLFLHIAEKDDPRAQFLVGRMLEEGQGVVRDPLKAAQWYRRAAQQGHAESQARLGFLYLGGTDVPQDNNEALKWFQTAAQENQHPIAQAYLCSIYAEGTIVPADQKLSLEWCRKAAERGVPAAQTMMGFHHALGKALPMDRAVARQWFELAAKQGYAGAIKALAEMDQGKTPNPEAGLPPAFFLWQATAATEKLPDTTPKKWE
ncbi:MAG: sel1 repeat family protein [Magnetococcales bacterium]|nr:sel1 repeat family protein [Magnetococcales bacterium]